MKTKISVEEAKVKLFNFTDDDKRQISDILVDLVDTMFNEKVSQVEKQHVITDSYGEEFDNPNGEEWHNGTKGEFTSFIYDEIYLMLEDITND